MTDAILTEDQIESIAERRMDRLDELFLTGKIDAAEYGQAVKDLDREIVELHAAHKRLRDYYAVNLGE